MLLLEPLLLLCALPCWWGRGGQTLAPFSMNSFYTLLRPFENLNNACYSSSQPMPPTTTRIGGEGGLLGGEKTPLVQQPPSFEENLPRGDSSSFIDVSDVALERSERWRSLAAVERRRDSTSGRPYVYDYRECATRTDGDVDPFAAASLHLLDAQAGRKMVPHIHHQWELRVATVVVSRSFYLTIRGISMLVVLLPFLEVPGYLFGPSSTRLWEGWRPTLLGSSCIEILIAILLSLDVVLLYCIRDRCSGRSFASSSAWAAARAGMVALLWIDLATFFVFHFGWGLVWYRWSRLLAPFIFISKGDYLKVFLRGVFRIMPRLLPIVLVVFFVVSFYGYLGFVLFSHRRRDLVLQDLPLFRSLSSSILTTLRIFTSIPAMLDVEEEYQTARGVKVFCMSYALITVVLLGTLVTAVANRNFQAASLEAYQRAQEQRARSLHLAFSLICSSGKGEGTMRVSFVSWCKLMARLRPSLSQAHLRLLFDMGSSDDSSSSDGVTKGAFFQICALADDASGSADPPVQHGRRGSVKRLVRHAYKRYIIAPARWLLCQTVLIPRSRVHVNFWWAVFHVMVVLQASLQVATTSLMTSSTSWHDALDRYRSARALIIFFFWIDSLLRAAAWGPGYVLTTSRHAWSVIVNVVALSHFVGLWPSGSPMAERIYALALCTRVLVLWGLLYDFEGAHSEVARRIVLVFDAIFRSFGVLLAVVYAGAVISFGWFGDSAIGVQPLDPIGQDPMVKRFVNVEDVAGFQSFGSSLLTMLDVMLLSNWPLFMDAASVVASVPWLATLFFYLFKILVFYIVKPVMIGFVVQSYMNTRLPERSASEPAPVYVEATPGQGGDTDGWRSFKKSEQWSEQLQGVLSPASDDEMLALGSHNKSLSAASPPRLSIMTRKNSDGLWRAQAEQSRQTRDMFELQDTIVQLQQELREAKAMAARARLKSVMNQVTRTMASETKLRASTVDRVVVSTPPRRDRSGSAVGGLRIRRQSVDLAADGVPGGVSEAAGSTGAPV
jgi:hypothetical protein